MLIHVKLDYDHIKRVVLHNLGNSNEMEITNNVMIRELDPYIRELEPNSFYESGDTVEIQVSPEVYKKIDEHLSASFF
jgi:hypothetical protein